jgi:hypothetical protein
MKIFMRTVNEDFDMIESDSVPRRGDEVYINGKFKRVFTVEDVFWDFTSVPFSVDIVLV